MRFVVVALVCMGCGRLGFQSHSSVTDDAAGAVDSVGNGDVPSDVVPAPVCGDGTCDGVAGELCASCLTDCNTTAVVCGNNQCDASEDGTTCPGDCGPAPWPFVQEDTDLLTAVNAARVAGTICPGEMVMRTAAALTTTAALVRGVREQAWETAHGQLNHPDGSSCNGRTFVQRLMPYGATSALMAYSTTGPFATMTGVVNVWKSDTTNCPYLMSTTVTQATTGVAHDAWDSYVIWFR